MTLQTTERTATDEATPPTSMTATGDLATILDVMRTMMVDRERREKEITEEMRKQDAERTRERERQERIREEERRRYEEENERQITATNKQMEMLQDLVRGHTEKDAKSDSNPMKLTRLTDVDDVESYLATFKRGV